MKPKYLQGETAGRDRWMISYVDVLTILLIFFIAVGAKSVEATKFVDPPRSAAIEPPPVQPPAQPQEKLRERLEAEGLDWHADPRGVVIGLPQAVLFPPGRAEINAAALPMVGQIADVLREVPNRISLAGHADGAPIHNRLYKNNWELAAARSLSLLEALTSRYGIAESRLSIASYGSNDPRNPNDTADGRAGNRRVEILVLDENDR